MKTGNQLFVTILFISFIFVVPIWTKLSPPKEISFYENRKLADPPKWDKTDFLNGEYGNKWEAYFSDQIVGRNTMLKFYTALQLNVLHKQVVNDQVVQKDILLPFHPFFPSMPTDKDAQAAEEIADSLAALQQNITSYGGKFYYMGIGEQCSYFRNRYPQGLENNNALLNETKTIVTQAFQKKEIPFIDMQQRFEQLGNLPEYYSRIDHHFTDLGAFEAYRYLMERINQEQDTPLAVLQQQDLQWNTLQNPFLGSRSRKLFGLYQLEGGEEHPQISMPKDPLPFTRIDNGQQVESRMFALPVDNAVPVAYSLYMGGDVPETVIQTNRPELPNLLLFGDSFTNPVESYLYYGFNETRILDLRYYNEKKISDYIQEYQPDIVVCLRDDTAYLSRDGNGNIK